MDLRCLESQCNICVLELRLINKFEQIQWKKNKEKIKKKSRNKEKDGETLREQGNQEKRIEF